MNKFGYKQVEEYAKVHKCTFAQAYSILERQNVGLPSKGECGGTPRVGNIGDPKGLGLGRNRR